MKIKLSKISENRIIEIFEYIANDSLYNAENYIDKLIDKIYKLSEFPYIGRKIRESKDETLRELIFSPYRIIYKIKNNEILVLNIIHSKQNYKYGRKIS